VNARLPLVIKGSVQTAGVQIYFHRDLSIAQFDTSASRCELQEIGQPTLEDDILKAKFGKKK